MKQYSVIIATYNSGRTLSRCLDSIIPQLHEDGEVVVFDGGSEDNTMDIVHSYGDKIAYSVSEPDRGVYDAWNKALKVVTGKWIIFIGSDDVLLPNAFSHYRNFLKNNGEDFDIVSAKLHFVDAEGKVLTDVGEPWNWHKFIRKKLSFAHPGLLHNRRLFEKNGGFDLQYKICADSDFFQRACKEVKAGYIDEFLVNMASGGMSNSYKSQIEGFKSRWNNKVVPRIILLYDFGRTLMNALCRKIINTISIHRAI